jgi:predicted nucleic acid-binding protein
VIVVDANVLVYFWAGGPGARLARGVLERDPIWTAPLLWRSQFRNAMARLARGRLLNLEQAMAAIREAELHMGGHEYGVASHAVLTLARRSGCSAYDCEYVALAEDLEIPLVTFDDQVTRAFPDRAVAPETFLAD